jgi:hypothetical protein
MLVFVLGFLKVGLYVLLVVVVTLWFTFLSGWFGLMFFGTGSLGILLLLLLLVVFSLGCLVVLDMQTALGWIVLVRMYFFFAQGVVGFYVSFEMILLPISIVIFL